MEVASGISQTGSRLLPDTEVAEDVAQDLVGGDLAQVDSRERISFAELVNSVPRCLPRGASISVGFFRIFTETNME